MFNPITSYRLKIDEEDDNESNSILFTLFGGGRKLGVLDAKMCGAVMYITGFSVTPGYTNQGHGTYLLKRAVDYARKNGAGSIELGNKCESPVFLIELFTRWTA